MAHPNALLVTVDTGLAELPFLEALGQVSQARLPPELVVVGAQRSIRIRVQSLQLVGHL